MILCHDQCRMANICCIITGLFTALKFLFLITYNGIDSNTNILVIWVGQEEEDAKNNCTDKWDINSCYILSLSHNLLKSLPRYTTVFHPPDILVPMFLFSFSFLLINRI